MPEHFSRYLPLSALPNGHRTRRGWIAFLSLGAGGLVLLALLMAVTSPVTQASSAARQIEENLPAGTAIGEPVTDANLAGQLTHTLAGKDADSFNIDGASGQLQTVEPLNYEVRRKYDVTVRIKHDDGTTDIPVTISVLDVEEQGVVSVAPATLRAGTVIRGRLTDPDGGVIPGDALWDWSVSSDGSQYSSVAVGIPGSISGRSVEAAAFAPGATLMSGSTSRSRSGTPTGAVPKVVRV